MNPPATGRRFGEWPGRLLLLFAGLLLAIVAAELYVRTFYSFVPRLRLGSGATRLSDEVTRRVFEADQYTIWRIKPNLVATGDHFAFRGVLSNAQRVRATRTIGSEKAPDEFRILFLGDSVTFGWGVDQDETFAALTEHALRDRFPAVVTTSINAGVPAFSLLQGWHLLEAEGFAYQPDLVVVSFGSNDITSWGSIGDFEQFELWRLQQPPDFLSWSHLARLLAGALGRQQIQPVEQGKQRPRLYPEEFREVLDRIREAARAHGAAMLVIVEAYKANLDGTVARSYRDAYQLESEQFGRSLRLGSRPEPALVDGVLLFQQMIDGVRPSDLFADHIHPTPAGHAALAEALVARIAPWLDEQLLMERFGPTTAARSPSD